MQLSNVTRGNSLTGFNDHFTFAINDIEAHGLTTKTLRDQRHEDISLLELECSRLKEVTQDLFVGHFHCAQQNRCWQFTAAVNPDEHLILRIKFEIQPRTTVRNNPSRIEQLARAVGLSFVVLKEHPWRPVQLGHNDSLSSIDHEGSVVSHERDFAHVDFFFLDVLDRLIRAFFFKQHQAHFDAQWRRVGITTQNAFFHIEDRLTQTVAYVLELCVA